jgi:L-rhamnose mutarotase
VVRKAFVMGVHPLFHDEYEKRHNPIWVELEETLKTHGVHNYSIFLLPETSQLFAYVEVESVERWDAVAQTIICQKWWIHMKDIMPVNPDNSPKSVELKCVFHID